MFSLNLPAFDAKIVTKDGKRSIFDVIRRRYVALTPEEWVRQHFVNFLITHRAFPGELMANEVALKLNNTARRADTLVYTRSLKPLCVIEYKAPDIVLTQNVFDQIARSNSVIEAPYLIVSNGMHHYCCRYSESGYTFLRDIPCYSDMLGL